MSACAPVADPERRGAGRAAERPLGNSTGRYGAAVRADRWEALRFLWKRSALRRVRTCRRVRYATAVTLSKGEHGGRLDGLVRCGSPWACPVCSAAIQAGRAGELAQAIENHHHAGGHVALLTLTMRHNARQRLSDLWDALSPSWNVATAQNRAVRTAREQAGVLGFARTVEATHGRNGWHLHIHALVFIKPDGDLDHGLDALDDAIANGWMRALERRGMPTPTREHGCELRLLDMESARAEVARYVAKSAFTSERAAAAAALEVTSTQTKAAGYGNRTPWQILATAIGGEKRAAALWSEWETVSRGRRCHTWSRGLRAALQLDEEEQSDDELVDDTSEQDKTPTPMLRFHPPAWDRWITKTDVIPALLTAADTGDQSAAILALAALSGRPPTNSIEHWNQTTRTWAPLTLPPPAPRTPEPGLHRTDRDHTQPRNAGGVWSRSAEDEKRPSFQGFGEPKPPCPAGRATGDPTGDFLPRLYMPGVEAAVHPAVDPAPDSNLGLAAAARTTNEHS